MERKVFMIPNVTGPTEAVTIDPDVCVGCNECADICRMQTIMPNPEPGKPPVVVYPDECWYCACCVEVCRTGALTMNLPINQRIFFKRKQTGEVFRLGQSGGPGKSYFKPPIGRLDDSEEYGGMEPLFQTGANPGTPDMERRLRRVLADHRGDPSALVPVLQQAQSIYGYLDRCVLEAVAQGMGMSAAQVASAASFYSFFRREQYGRHIIRVCRSAPCHISRAQETLLALEKALGICVGGTTPDGGFSLLTCECLGVCDRAPAVMIDETVCGPVCPEDVAGLLARFGWEGT